MIGPSRVVVPTLTRGVSPGSIDMVGGTNLGQKETTRKIAPLEERVMEPHRLKKWTIESSMHFFSCARPGRSKYSYERKITMCRTQ